MYNETITYYSKTPPNKWVLDHFDISHWEENRTCGDDVKIYIKIENNTIRKWSFDGDTAIITTACASIFGESIIGLKIEEVFNFWYSYIEDLIQAPISERRRQASVLGLLTTRNAIHKYLWDEKIDVFDDVLNI